MAEEICSWLKWVRTHEVEQNGFIKESNGLRIGEFVYNYQQNQRQEEEVIEMIEDDDKIDSRVMVKTWRLVGRNKMDK